MEKENHVNDKLGRVEQDLLRLEAEMKLVSERKRPYFQAAISVLLGAAIGVEAWMLLQIVSLKERTVIIEKWTQARPDFTTRDQATILVTGAKEELRKEINAKLDTLIAGQAALQLQLTRHEAETKKP